jgi:phage repressor protein C with HTH and peptisase S24 domain/DNA-binding XRE family transcriptional regulator
MSQSDLAKLLGTTGVSVGRYEKEPGRVTVPLLEEIASALNCRVADLMGEGQIIEQPVVVLPFRGNGKRLAFDGDQVDRIGKPSTLQAIEVEDDAMSPTLAKGDIVLIDKTVAKVTKDGVYAIEASGHTMVKRVSFNPIRKTLTITNDNALYAPIGDAKPNDVRIAGRVVWAGKRL